MQDVHNPEQSLPSKFSSDNVCPVTGLSIFQKPEWIDVSFDKDYRLTLSIIGGGILLVRVFGRATLYSLEQAAMFINRIQTEAISQDRFIRIEEWSNLKGVSQEARRYYIDYIKNQERLLDLIFCGLSPMLNIAVRLGKRFNIIKFNVHVVKDYSNALRISKIKLFKHQKRFKGPYPETVSHMPVSHEGGSHRETVTDPDWSLQYENYSLRFEVLWGNILHGITTGRLDAEHIAPSLEIQYRILRAMSSLGEPYYFVLGFEESEGTGQKARKLYFDAILALYQEYPFQIFIFYGVNKLLGSGIRLYKPFVPFPIKIVKDLDSALRYIAEEDSKTDVSVKELNKTDQIQQYVVEVLQTIEGIDWETGGISRNVERSRSHPFSPVFDAIDLIKWELDDLFQERTQTMEKLEKAYEDLRDTQAQLVQSGKLSSIGELASGVAHELNQPLMVIRSNSQLIQRKLQKNELNGEELSEQITSINRNTKRMMNIIDHLRAFSRQSQKTFSPVNINQVLEDAFLMVGEQLRIRNIDVKWHLDSKLPMINGDANQLEQVFLNLITNARDAMISIVECGMENGDLTSDSTDVAFKGKLEIITRPGDKDNQQSKGFVEILLRDNGGGIPADSVDKIFDPFFTTKEVGKGTGLGLSISYGIIKDHGGEIHVADTGKEGTTFRVRFPVEY
jgi:signal transduction histidine kinase